MFWQVCPGFPGRPVPDAGTSALSWALLTCQRAAQCALLGSAPLLTAVLSLSGCFGLKLLTHLLSQFLINALGFTASCWIKCKVCKRQLLAYSLLHQHWEGFSSSQPAAAIVIVFGPQLSQSHKIRLFPKSPPRNLWTWKERDISKWAPMTILLLQPFPIASTARKKVFFPCIKLHLEWIGRGKLF